MYRRFSDCARRQSKIREPMHGSKKEFAESQIAETTETKETTADATAPPELILPIEKRTL